MYLFFTAFSCLIKIKSRKYIHCIHADPEIIACGMWRRYTARTPPSPLGKIQTTKSKIRKLNLPKLGLQNFWIRAKNFFQRPSLIFLVGILSSIYYSISISAERERGERDLALQNNKTITFSSHLFIWWKHSYELNYISYN